MSQCSVEGELPFLRVLGKDMVAFRDSKGRRGMKTDDLALDAVVDRCRDRLRFG